MRPEQGSDIIKIPVTFEGGGGNRARQAGMKMWIFLIFVFWVIISIVSLIVAETIKGYLFPLYALFGLSYILRYIVFREKFYRARRKALLENDFMFDHTVFWNIYDISYRHPHFITFETGVKGLFIAFDKGVIIGKGENSDFYHHEALTEAYQQVLNRGMQMVHIDYMDVVGKDKRMESLFDLAEKTTNPDIRKVLTRIYDHTEYLMNTSYASYDVYAFSYRGREEQFWFEMEQCLNFFRRANYLRYRVLDREGITQLVESTMNVEEFSVNRANDSIFKKLNFMTEYIKAIWVEQGGKREILNNTREQIAETRRVNEAEKKVKKKGNIFTRRKSKDAEEDINLFGVGFEEGEFTQIKQQANDRQPSHEESVDSQIARGSRPPRKRRASEEETSIYGNKHQQVMSNSNLEDKKDRDNEETNSAEEDDFNLFD